MNSRKLALVAVALATTIYGISFTIAKEIMPYISPFGLILLRVSGATLVFWTLSLFTQPTKKIERKDFPKIILCAFFGVALNMLTFFKGLSYTSPISAAVMMLSAPICVLILSTVLLKSKLNKLKITGIIIGLLGAYILTIYGKTGNQKIASNPVLGNFLVFVNAASYGTYLVISKKIINKYDSILFIKWLYLFGLIFVIPFGIKELLTAKWELMSEDIYWKVAFIVGCTTCLTYLFNLYGLKKLKPTTVSVFIYLQPVIAALYAVFTGSDEINPVKISAALIIFTGVYLVTRKEKATA